ncbi:MAG: hypothetical protein ACERKF_01315 [Vibrio cyclitrophicus]
MDIFKKINESLKSVEIEDIQKTKKTPIPRFQKNRSGKVLYLIVRDSEIKNEKGNATHITLIKLPITASHAPRGIADLVKRFGTEEAKNGKYVITDDNFATLLAHFIPANKLYKQFVKEAVHEKQDVVIKNNTHSVCSVAALIHQAAEALDHLESVDELDVIEGQEIHQALYRVKSRLTAARMPDTFYNEFLFKESDQDVNEDIRSKRKFTLEDKSSLMRFAKVFDQLTSLKTNDQVKSSKRDKIKELHEKITK